MMRPRFFLPMAERERLLDRLRAQVEREAEVEFATVFGSFLDPELPFADIDVGLGLAPGADPLQPCHGAQVPPSPRRLRPVPGRAGRAPGMGGSLPTAVCGGSRALGMK